MAKNDGATDQLMPQGDPRLKSADGKSNIAGRRVKVRRESLGLTQAELSAQIARATEGHWNPWNQEVLNIERGRRSITDIELMVMAKVLNCSVEWLLGLSDSEGSNIKTA